MDELEQRARATRIYQRALRRGELTRALFCELCASPARTHGHHWRGYEDTQALDVQWLCQPCHNRVHTGRAGGLVGGRAFAALPVEQLRESGRKGGRAHVVSKTPEEWAAMSRLGGAAFVEQSSPAQRAAMGRKGGIEAAARLTAEQLSDRGRRAAEIRWAKKKGQTLPVEASGPSS